jgi:hypothetical protein
MITTGGGGGSHESGGPEDTDIDVAFNLRTPNSGVNILNTNKDYCTVWQADIQIHVLVFICKYFMFA